MQQQYLYHPGMTQNLSSEPCQKRLHKTTVRRRNTTGAVLCNSYHLFLILACFFAYCPLFSYAQGVNALKSFVKDVNTAQGNFEQIQSNSKGRIIAQTSGHFIFSRPGKFIWSTLKPYEQLLQSDGRALYVWDKDLNQVTVRKLDQALAASPAAILFGNTTLERYFKLKEEGIQNGTAWVKLEPLTQDSPFTGIKIGFRHNQLLSMKLDDALGNITELRFTHLNTANPSVQPNFNFKIPANADVIEQ